MASPLADAWLSISLHLGVASSLTPPADMRYAFEIRAKRAYLLTDLSTRPRHSITHAVPTAVVIYRAATEPASVFCSRTGVHAGLHRTAASLIVYSM